MTPPPPPLPPPAHLNLRTTAQIIKQSSATFFSNFTTFFFLSLLLFTYRSAVENGTFFVTTFIDRDPSLKSLLSRLDLSGKNVKSPESFRSQALAHRRRRPFLHLSRVGTLDDEFFSGDDRSLLGSVRKSPVNGSFVNLRRVFRSEGKLGFSDSEKDDGIRFMEIVGSEFVFKAEGFSLSHEVVDDSEVGEDEDRRPPQSSPAVDIQFFFKGLELGRRDAAALFFLVSFLSAAYGWVILGFLITNSCILGIVFLVVVNSLLGKYSSNFRTIWAGCRLGIKRLSGVILMRWAVKDAMTQVLGLWFFGEVDDQHSFFKLFVRLKLMPINVTSPWIRGYETEISQFLFMWFLADALVGLVFAVDCWVAIMDARSGKEILKEGLYLISTMAHQSIQLNCFEAILCGSLVKWVLTWIFGDLLTAILQSVVEVYFMVVWLSYYFATRCKDASSDGRVFGRRDLEDSLDALR